MAATQDQFVALEAGPGRGEAADAMVTSLSLEPGALLLRPSPFAAQEQRPAPTSAAKRHKASDAGRRSPGAAAARPLGAPAAAAEPVTRVQGECAVCQQSATEEAPLNWVVRPIPYLRPG